jgi:hypothetical protein
LRSLRRTTSMRSSPRRLLHFRSGEIPP